MAQNHLKFGTYIAPDPDEDGDEIVFATTSSDTSARTMRGDMKNSATCSRQCGIDRED